MTTRFWKKMSGRGSTGWVEMWVPPGQEPIVPMRMVGTESPEGVVSAGPGDWYVQESVDELK